MVGPQPPDLSVARRKSRWPAPEEAPKFKPIIPRGEHGPEGWDFFLKPTVSVKKNIKASAKNQNKHVRICFNMIVHKDAHVIERCIKSVAGMIDCFLIQYNFKPDDPVDETTPRILSLMEEHGIPGKVVKDPWLGFAKNRTMVLESGIKYAKEVDPEGEFVWYFMSIDADDQIFPVGCPYPGDQSKKVVMTQEEKDAFWADEIEALTRNSPSICWNMPLMFRFGIVGVNETIPVKWQCPIHECLKHTGNASKQVYTGLWRSSGRDGSRNQFPYKYLDDALVAIKSLENGTSDWPGRMTFYAAQSFRDAFIHREAKKWYLKAAHANDLDAEHRYVAFREAAWQTFYNDKNDFEESMEYFLNAQKVLPFRLDALGGLLEELEKRGRWLTMMTAARPWIPPVPHNSFYLFLDERFQYWRTLDLIGLAAQKTGEMDIALKMAMFALNNSLNLNKEIPGAVSDETLKYLQKRVTEVFMEKK